MLRRHGTLVFRYEWDHGTPLVGAHADVVYAYRGGYYTAFSYDGRLIGPSETLDKALSEPLLGVTAATQAIWCSELPRAEVIRRLVIYDDGAGRVIEVNGKPWRAPRRRITVAAVQAHLARWKSESMSVATREATSHATWIASQMAASDAHYLEAALARLRLAPTWASAFRELRQLRLASWSLEQERQRLLDELAPLRKRGD